MDTRAQSIGIARFFLVLGVGAVCFFIASQVTSPVLDRAHNSTTNATANQATVWFRDVIDLLPLLILFLALLSVIVLAVYQREVLR
jgi:hypothetical protein